MHSQGNGGFVGPELNMDGRLDTQPPGRVDFPVVSTSDSSYTSSRGPSKRPSRSHTDLSLRARTFAADAFATSPHQRGQVPSTPLVFQDPVEGPPHTREPERGSVDELLLATVDSPPLDTAPSMSVSLRASLQDVELRIPGSHTTESMSRLPSTRASSGSLKAAQPRLERKGRRPAVRHPGSGGHDTTSATTELVGRVNPVEGNEPTHIAESIGLAHKRLLRQAFIKAKQQISQLNVPSGSHLGRNPTGSGAQGLTKAQHRTSASFAEEDDADSMEDDEDDDFIPEPDPERETLRSPKISQKAKSTAQRTRVKHKASPRDSHRMHRKSSHTYVRGAETRKYSREADYKRYEIKKLHDGARCGFCHTKVSRLPDTAYRHLRDSCERFQDSDFYLKNEQPELSRADLAKMAVAARKMVVQLPCRNDADYKMRLKAIGSTPAKIERRLARYASIYKIGNCTCCPHPSYSTYRPPS
ncbi:hypothetical protein C8Q79DRAFT_201430 [Trametes meyenii]|nr:hypothetical protein C8Q79DRAFT_201430 [Trametes meyenii]